MYDIRCHPLFRNVSDNSIDTFLSDSRCESVQFQKGDVIYSPTVYRRSVGIVTVGSAIVRKPHGTGDSVVLRRLDSGDMFGVAALFVDGDRYVTEIAALTACSVTFFPEQLVNELLERDSVFAKNYIAVLSGRINFLNMLIAGYSAQTVSGKLAHFLLMNACGDTVTMPYGMSELAERLGVGRASLYRVVDEFVGDGIISRDGKRIIVLDFEKLKQNI